MFRRKKGDNIQAAQRPLPPEPITRGTVGAGLLAHVLVCKWWDHLPLYRLEGILARLGWEVSRSTLCDQMMRCAELLTPLYDLSVPPRRGQPCTKTSSSRRPASSPTTC
jgi:transposase